MLKRLILGSMSMVFIVAIVALSCAAEQQKEQSSQEPNIEGTYKLVSREFADGTKQGPPDIMGLITYTKTHRNFNVMWKDAEGKLFSYSLVSTYKLTASEYNETVMFSILNDQIGGKEIKYDLSGPSQSAPVTMEDGRIKVNLPFDPVTVTIEGDKMKAESQEFVDYWEKVE